MFTWRGRKLRHRDRKQQVQGHISDKWQKQNSSPCLGNFSAHTRHDHTTMASLASQGTIVEDRMSLLIQVTSVLNLSPLLCSHPQHFQYLLRALKCREWERLGAKVESVHSRETSFGVYTQANTDWQKKSQAIFMWTECLFCIFHRGN